MSRKKIYEHKSHGAEFLDPAEVGSHIHWTIAARVHETAVDGKPIKTSRDGEVTVNLGDCSRSIGWSCYVHSADETFMSMHRKLDRAINQMRECQRQLTLAEAGMKKAHKSPDDEED